MAIRTNYSHTDFYNLIKNKINEFSENKPTYWGNGSIARAIVKAVAFFNEYLQLQTNITFSSFRIKTAKGLHLDNRAGDFNVTRTASTNAIGIQRFIGTTGRIISLTIPAGTTVSTEADIFGNSIGYTLNGTLILSSGEVSVTGLITCSKEGLIGNVVSGTITQLPAAIVGVERTFNVEDIANGAEDENDRELRARIPSSVRGLQRANKSSIESAVYGLQEITFVEVTENSPADGNFTVYITTETGIVDTITRQRVDAVLDTVKSFCVTYSVITPIVSGITISLDVAIDGQTYLEQPMGELVKATVSNYINTKAIAAVTTSDLNFVVRKIDGVENVRNILINGVASDVTLARTYVLKILDNSHITVNFI